MIIIRARFSKPHTGKSNAEYMYFARHSDLELHNSFEIRERLLKDLPAIFSSQLEFIWS